MHVAALWAGWDSGQSLGPWGPVVRRSGLTRSLHLLGLGGFCLQSERDGTIVQLPSNLKCVFLCFPLKDAVVRNVYYKYFHPKEALVSNGVLNRWACWRQNRLYKWLIFLRGSSLISPPTFFSLALLFLLLSFYMLSLYNLFYCITSHPSVYIPPTFWNLTPHSPCFQLEYMHLQATTKLYLTGIKQ